MNWERRITRLTQLVRRGDDPMHARLRALLRIRGIDVGSALVANLMPDGPGLDTGLVVTRESRVYEFDLYHRDRPLAEAEFRVWRDVTDTAHAHWNRDAVA